MIPIEPCKCGEIWAHCYKCGGRSVYVRSKESEWLSASLKRTVTSFKCKTCGFEFNTSMECLRPAKITDFIAGRKETPAEIAKRFNDAGKGPEELIVALIEAGYNVAPTNNGNKETQPKEELPPPAEQPKEIEIPISIEDILSASKKNKEIL